MHYVEGDPQKTITFDACMVIASFHNAWHGSEIHRRKDLNLGLQDLYCTLVTSPEQSQAQLLRRLIMAALAKALPKPKYTGQDEELAEKASTRGPKVVGAGAIDETQIALRVSSMIESFYIPVLTPLFRGQAHHHTATVQDGDRDRQKILEMEAHSPRCQSRSILSIWDGRSKQARTR